MLIPCAHTPTQVFHRGLDVHGSEPYGGPWDAQPVEPMYSDNKLDAMGVNLDHWA